MSHEHRRNDQEHHRAQHTRADQGHGALCRMFPIVWTLATPAIYVRALTPFAFAIVV